jgi:hypothetical protein|tara:strand:+ start:6199 stop:6402 length:204 start_codon:yes stop_codon:yes gene_type:complete
MNKRIEDWSDERAIGNGIIVTLHYGFSFEYMNHEAVRGFDTLEDAREDTKIKWTYTCNCAECKAHKK